MAGWLILVLLAAWLVAKYVFKVNPPLAVPGKEHTPELHLDKLQLPKGFKVEIYASDIKNARSLCLSPEGTLYVGTRSAGNVYALKDTDGDNRCDKKFTLLTEGNMPNGVAVKDGDLYIAEVNRILKIPAVESRLEDPGTPEVVFDKYPTESHHGWKYIAFGPDGKLYVPVGAPCNICESDSIYATITRINPDGSGMEIVQKGIRNTVGFAWQPGTNNLWFTDNGRDMMGDDIPDCELNHATQERMNFGYPYCHQGDVADPEFGAKHPCSDFTPPAARMGPHTAPLGMTFYTGNMFPAEYKNQILVARHGSWNRTKKSGYDIVFARLDAQGKVTEVKPFIEGWLNPTDDDVWGRPVDLEVMPDGSVLISDDFADVIYRVTYSAN